MAQEAMQSSLDAARSASSKTEMRSTSQEPFSRPSLKRRKIGKNTNDMNGADDMPTLRVSLAASSNSQPSYTPLEKQILSLKAQNPDTILLVEVGYKLKFFGDDAIVASRVLNIVCM